MWCKNEMEHASSTSTRRWDENNRNSNKLSSRFKTVKLNHIGVTDERVYYDVVLAKENGVNEENKKIWKKNSSERVRVRNSWNRSCNLKEKLYKGHTVIKNEIQKFLFN